MTETPYIIPEVTPLTEPYWFGAAAGQLCIQECIDCLAVWHPPQPLCPRCQSRDVRWKVASGRGTLSSYTIVHHPVHPAVETRVPYTVALVELEEGPVVITTITAASSELIVGAAVAVTFSHIGGTDLALPVFELTE